jgi:hypothetical protein
VVGAGRHTLLPIVLGICVVNGVFSPYLNVAIPISAMLMPELFLRTVERALFWNSVLLASATLLFSGVPAALYERLVERDPKGTASMWIWFAGAVMLSLPAVQRGL